MHPRLAGWVDCMQRPDHWVPGLRSRPWYDRAEFGWCRDLEQAFDDIRAEFQAAHAPGVAFENPAIDRLWNNLVLLVAVRSRRLAYGRVAQSVLLRRFHSTLR